jgi:hypothetical protein
MMKLIKDLLYTKGNEALDITRVSILGSVAGFWAGVGYDVVAHGHFDPLATGGGIAAVFGGAAGWLHFRQKHEGGE